MKIFSGQVFEVKEDKTRSEFLGRLEKFGFFLVLSLNARILIKIFFMFVQLGCLNVSVRFFAVFCQKTYTARPVMHCSVCHKKIWFWQVFLGALYLMPEKNLCWQEN